jgi:glycerol-3-phosphate O-acyltransferase
MHIENTDKTSLREIQEVFSNFYPYLKIEFFRHSHKKYESSGIQDLIDSNTTIGEVKDVHVSGLLEILPLYKVSEVEKEFQQRFGLSVQILRREKNGWEQTTGMDDFTLKDINEIGRNSSDEFLIEDYEEGFDEPANSPEKLY